MKDLVDSVKYTFLDKEQFAFCGRWMSNWPNVEKNITHFKLAHLELFVVYESVTKMRVSIVKRLMSRIGKLKREQATADILTIIERRKRHNARTGNRKLSLSKSKGEGRESNQTDIK